MRPSQPYKKFSRVYDLMGADRHSVRMVDYTFQIMRRFRIKPTRALDLCCGTGTAIALFLDRGVQMEGLDRSAGMLAVAARKLSGRKVPLHQKSLPGFKIVDGDGRGCRRYDLVTSYYDSLNYMKNSRDLRLAFKNVWQHLDAGGWFIFDMNTPEALKIVWGGQVYAGARDDLAWVWQNTYHPRTRSATCHTTFFIKRGKLWERFDEEHVEWAFENRQIKAWLRAAGFRIKGFYRCFSFEPPREGNYRICAVAQKSAKPRSA